MAVLLRGIGWAAFFYGAPWVAWMLLAGFMRNPGYFYLAVGLFAIAVLGAFWSGYQPTRGVKARRDEPGSARDVDAQIRLVMSPQFDPDRSVVPGGRVGGQRRADGWQPVAIRPVRVTSWREAVGPGLRRPE